MRTAHSVISGCLTPADISSKISEMEGQGWELDLNHSNLFAGLDRDRREFMFDYPTVLVFSKKVDADDTGHSTNQ